MRNEKLLKEVNTILENVSKAMEVERSSFFLLDSKTSTLESVVAQGLENIILSVPLGSGVVGRTVYENEAILENDAQSSKWFDPSFDSQLGFSTVTTLCTPVRNENGQVIGAVECLNKKRGIFVKKDLTVLNGFAASISLIVKNIELYFASERVNHKRIRSNLSRYIPRHMVNEVVSRDDLSVLQIKNRRCSVLFSDIRNFTKLTEELGAVQIVELLNRYFDAMVTSIHDYNGILDKFIGDAVMAVFGLPYTNSNDPVNAVRCALNMHRLLEDLNAKKIFGFDLHIGIGISTGNVISGNIGSQKRFEYTVIGDPVNLAARLENETKKHGAKVLICEETYKSVAAYFKCHRVGVVPIKGKRNPVKIYSVNGEKKTIFRGSRYSESFS